MGLRSSVQESSRRRRDDRGVSLSAFVAVVMLAVFLVAGLVVDGGAQVAAHRRAEVVAARAVRGGSDATAAFRLLGQDGSAQGLSAARQVLADEQVDGEASIAGGVITVTTHARVPTTFLSLLGIAELRADGSASAVLTPA